MISAEFEDLLKRTMGLDTASIGSSAVARAVEARMSACDLTDPRAYWDYIQTSQAELQELVEAVVIPETWFFRHREAFAALARFAREDWMARNSQDLLRLLSLPCSTGEEPYSMAMALLDAGFPPERFCIDAVDISASLLARAQRGLYGKNSFRGSELGFRDRYFEPTPHGYRLQESVRANVRFRQGNLLDADLPAGMQVYEVIFCRNILIYFDAATQTRTIDLLTRLLATDGVLFVGSSEANLVHNHGFMPMGTPLTFAFCKAAAAALPAPRNRSHPPKGHDAVHPIATAPPKPARRPVARSSVTKPLVRPALRTSPRRNPTLNEIRLLADQGRLAEAERHCEEYLRRHDPSSEALHLLGLIRDAVGNLPAAADCYRKTLYLDPRHPQALVHLALLLERQGDRAGAKVLNERARRLDQRQAK